MYPGLRYTNKKKNLFAKFSLEKVCSSTKFDLRVKKKQKKMKKKSISVAIKKMLVIHFFI